MYEHLDVLSASAIPLLTRPQRDANLARLVPAASAQETQTRKVVVLLASPESNAELMAWAEASGFDLSSDYGGDPRDPAAFDFHVTLLATVDPCGIPETEHPIEPLVVYADGFKVLGADRRVPCLSIDVEADDFGRVASMREHYIDTYGAEPTFADFVPHVSLSYAWDGAPALEDLAVPSMPIVLDRIRVKPLFDAPKSVRFKSLGPAVASVDTSGFVAAVTALQSHFAAYGAICDRYSDLVNEYYEETEDPARVRQIIAECRQIQQQARPFADANQPLVDAVDAAAYAIAEAIDAAASDIKDYYDLDYEHDYFSPNNLIDDVDSQLQEMEAWLADNVGEDAPKSRKALGLGQQAARQRKSFIDSLDQSVVDALMAADGGPDVLAAYRNVAAQIDDVDAEIGRISSAMENVRQLAEQLLAIRALGGTPPAPQDRAEAFARFDALQEELDVWTSEKRGLLEQASRLEGEMLRLIS